MKEDDHDAQGMDCRGGVGNGSVRLRNHRAGHWECIGSQCEPVCDFVGCGDGQCDRAGGESPQSCPQDCSAACVQEGFPTGIPPAIPTRILTTAWTTASRGAGSGKSGPTRVPTARRWTAARRYGNASTDRRSDRPAIVSGRGRRPVRPSSSGYRRRGRPLRP
jgi:hypothetical protein